MSTFVKTDEESGFAALVGIDWGDKQHAWSMRVTGSTKCERGTIDHSPEGIDAWVLTLRSRFDGQLIAMAVEQSRGPLVFLLAKYPNLRIYPIHPRSSAQFRKALHPSGAKDDPADADILRELLEHHREHFRPLSPDTVETRGLQNLVEARRKLVDERTAHSNQLTAQLKLYFPQMLDWFDDVASPLVGAMLERWPTLQALRKARREGLRSFLAKQNCRGRERIEERIEQIRKAIPATNDQAILVTAVTMTKVLVKQIAVLREGITALERQIAKTSEAHPDFPLFDSFPGAGPVLAPRLLAAFGSQRDRFASAADLQQFSGIAPVTERSGKSEWVHFRWACPTFLRQTFHEWAGHSIDSCDWARAYYQQQRARNNGHHAAVRALAFKWMRIAFRCWKDQVPYDDALYVDSLRRRGSPLVKLLDSNNQSLRPVS